MTPWSWYLDLGGLVMVAVAVAILTWLAAGAQAAVWRERAERAERVLRQRGMPAPLPDDGIVILPGLWGDEQDTVPLPSAEDTVPLPSAEETAVLTRPRPSNAATPRRRVTTCGRHR